MEFDPVAAALFASALTFVVQWAIDTDPKDRWRWIATLVLLGVFFQSKAGDENPGNNAAGEPYRAGPPVASDIRQAVLLPGKSIADADNRDEANQPVHSGRPSTHLSSSPCPRCGRYHGQVYAMN